MRDTSIDVRGTRVRLHEAGEGPAILYLHGIDGPLVERASVAECRRN